ncbi:hypothetical protein [uncultured Methanobrevibacter sp.]|uniref:hypothetical protein n=1 Tax=uncultured Methanobrevibacter sp. TaxID=253161 RepID=UPI0026036E9F|nr:hypothetical protein [uncultured Methanobrevibacter sp.]
MFKNSKKILIGKHFLIPLLFVILIFTSFGVSIDDAFAADLNQSADGIESGLNIEDKLGNSQENIVSMSLDESNSLGVGQNNELLGKTWNNLSSGGTFSDIRRIVGHADDGDIINLRGTFVAQNNYDQIWINKRVTITSDSGATLDAKGLCHIFVLNTTAAGSTIKHLTFQNGNRNGVGSAIHIKTNNITIYNCTFEGNTAIDGGAIYTSYDPLTAKNLVVRYCRFIKNHALKSAGALAAFGNNTLLENCVFDSNGAYNLDGKYVPFGGAIQLGLDEYVVKCTVNNCRFYNNFVNATNSGAHGGAGCLRDGIEYKRCIFINNSAGQGGALTFHSSGLVKDCTFTNNSAKYFGGAISTGYYLYAEMDFRAENCNFENNTAPIGGAIQVNGYHVNINDCNFNNNTVSQTGGAIHCNAENVNITRSNFNGNVANVDGGAVFLNGKNTFIKDSSFISNEAIPDVKKLDDGLGGAIYINSTQARVENSEFYYNTARNGSAIYYDKKGTNLKLENNVLFENQAWVYALPIYANDIYYGQTEQIGSVIHGGNNIGKYGDLSVSNAIYNAADNLYIKIDGENPVLGATTSGHLYQDDREYNMEILLTVVHEDGTVVYNRTLNSDCFGEVKDSLNNLKVGEYFVTAKHFEDTYYKAITNTTTFKVSPQVDNLVRKSSSFEEINYGDIVVWTLNIVNNGPNNATRVVVSDILPEGLTYLDDDTGGKYDNKTGILTFDFLEIGKPVVVNIRTLVEKTGTITNNVNVTAHEHDYNMTNNYDHSSINVKKACDLAVKKSVNASVVNLGDLVKWTVTVSNNGPDDATGVVVRDLLPKSLILVNSPSNYNKNTGEWNIGNLNKNAVVSLDLICRVNATGIIENNVSVSGQQYDYDMTNNDDSEIVMVNSACDLAIVKLVTPKVVNYTDVVTWTLIVSNNGPDDATGVEIYDVLPNGFVYLNSTKTYNDNKIVIGDLKAGDGVSVDIVCWANITGTFVNVASVKGEEFDQNPNNNRANASIVVKPAADLAVEKSVNVSVVNLGDLVKWTVTVSNNGPDDATGVVVRDLLPKSLILVNSPNNYNKNTGEWNIGNLNKNSVVSLDLICRVNATGVSENEVSVSGNEHDYNLSNNYDSAVIDVNPASDLAIVKLVSPKVVNYTDVVTWTLIVSNNGPDDASGVEIYDVLPNGFVYLNSTKSYNDNKIVIGDLKAGDSVSVDIVCWANVTGTFVNVASVKGNEFDQNEKNNKANASIVVKPAADLSVVKEVNNTNPNFNDLVKWTITVSNNGPNDATGVVVRDLLPKSLVLVKSVDGYDEKSGRLNIGTLSKNASISFDIVCRVNATGVSENDVSVSANEHDHNPSNNHDSAVIDVSPASDLAIVKLVSHKVVNYTDVVTWTLIVSNNGPDVATGVEIYDVLPNGFVYMNSTKQYKNNKIFIGNLGVGESVSVDIVCWANITGTFVNVASVNGSQYDHNPANNKANVSIVVKPAADLAVVKSVNNTKPNFNDLVKWTITVSNNGPDDATGVVVKDLLPNSLVWTNDNGLGKYNHFSGIWEIGEIIKGGTKTLEIIARVNGTGLFTNVVTVTGNEFDHNKSNNRDDKTINVSKSADLSVIKLANESVVNYHQIVKWTVIASNNGPDNATGVVVDEILPNGLILLNHTASKGIYDNGMWSVCCLQKGESQTLELICYVNRTGDLTNFVRIGGAEYDYDKSNNEAESSIFVPRSSDLEIIKNVNNSNPNYGDVVEWSIVVINNGPDATDDIIVIDVLPQGLELIDYTASSGQYVDEMWFIDHLATGGSESLLIRCTVKTLEDVENVAEVVPSQYDWNMSNNKDEEAISANPIADLAIEKLVNVSQANYLDLVKWTLIVHNNGPNDATGVTVSDVIPNGLAIVSVSGDGEYENSIWDIGDLANGESKILDIVCKIQATGNFTNVANVWAVETDPDLSNNEDEKDLLVNPASDISITKTVSKYRYSVGDVVSYSIKLTNMGPDRAENVEVKEVMDDSLKLKSFKLSKGNFNKLNDIWSVDALDVGESAFLKINALADKAGSALNSVSATSNNYDPDLTNNDDEVTVNVTENSKEEDIPDENDIVRDELIREYSKSILEKNKSGNPLMVIALIIVFSVGIFCGRDIFKRR